MSTSTPDGRGDRRIDTAENHTKGTKVREGHEGGLRGVRESSCFFPDSLSVPLPAFGSRLGRSLALPAATHRNLRDLF
jgi:hypothetical protein